MGNSVSSRRRREARNLIKAIKRDDADSIRAVCSGRDQACMACTIPFLT